MRYAVQIVTQIGSGIEDINIPNAELLTLSGRDPELVLDLINTGTSWLHPQVSVELYSKNKGSIGSYTSRRKRLYPGTSYRYSIPLKDVSIGNYTALAVINGGDDGLFATQFDLSVRP